MNNKRLILLLGFTMTVCVSALSQGGTQQPQGGMQQPSSGMPQSQTGTQPQPGMPQTGMQQPSTSQAGGSAEQEIRALEDQSLQAAQKNDPSFLEQHATDDYTAITGMGDVVTKNQVVSDMRSGKMRYQSIQRRNMTVRMYGNTAVVNGEATLSLTRDGQPISGDYRYTRVWVKQDGGWKMASFESTPIRPQAK